MQKPELPKNEKTRIKALHELRILDTVTDPVYDQLVELAASICGTEMALLSFIDSERQWFKSTAGTNLCESDRDLSICGHAILQRDTFIIPDTLKDTRFYDNPFLLKYNLRFYAGIPLMDAEGHALGTLCVLNSQPMELSEQQLAALRTLSEHVNLLLAKRRSVQIVSQYQRELESYQRKFEEEQQITSDLMARMMRIDRLQDPALAYWNQAADLMGGDLIAAMHSPYGKYYTLIADSTGHGLPAAINLIPISETFYSMAAKSLPLDLMVDAMNRKIRELSPINRFVAAILVCIDAENRTIEIWNGGMPTAILIDSKGEVERQFESTDLALGINCSEEKPRSQLYQWKDATQLVAYSDGLNEASNRAGEQYGSKRVENIIASACTEERFDTLKTSILEHTLGQSPHDDISLIAITLDKLKHRDEISHSEFNPLSLENMSIQ
ncbi:MAG: SpoIIE family protein phosphatase [Gammaproteobacteria bacterium]|nr:SpoIIE family protein phosphatase [Gammaproteobacteria bacterium]